MVALYAIAAPLIKVSFRAQREILFHVYHAA